MQMRCLIILLSFFSLDSIAQGASLYRWYPLKTRFPEGECMEMGRTSDGLEVANKVKLDMCRPDKVTIFWINNYCYEVDSGTMGKAYGKKIETELCTPKEIAFAFDFQKRQCWVVDKLTGGKEFRRKASKSECRPSTDELKIIFIAKPNSEVGGDCYETHKALGKQRWLYKLDIRDCKPDSTKFAWLSLGQYKGQCWEVENENPQLWSRPARTEDCKPKKTIFSLDRVSELKGICYEVDSETEGSRWALKVDTDKCFIKKE